MFRLQDGALERKGTIAPGLELCTRVECLLSENAVFEDSLEIEVVGDKPVNVPIRA